MAAKWTWGEPEAPDAAAVQKLSAPTKWVVESMGWTFDNAMAQWCPELKREAPVEEEEELDENSPTASSASGKAKKEQRIRSTKLTEAEVDGDHYEYLGLDGEGEGKTWQASEEQITIAYKKKILEHHPDKSGGEDFMFKRIQVAGDVLLNKGKRRTYDSSLEYNDSIPPAKIDREKFYEIFDPVFKRNAMWHVNGKDDPPALGDAETPMEEVDSFYTYWLGFKSWRDFSYSAAEHNLEQADGRDERRWMEKENQRAVDKAKKAENVRLMNLVERAYKNDPRIRERETRADREREERRIAADEAKAKAKRDAAEAEEKARVEAELAKMDHKARLKEEKRARQSIRKLVRDYDGSGPEDINKAHLDWLIGKQDLAAMKMFCDALTPLAGEKEKAHAFVYGEVAKMEEATKETRDGNEM